MNGISSPSRISSSRIRISKWLSLSALAALVVATGVTGCKILPDDLPAPPPTEAAAPSGACASYTDRVCQAAGERSSTCAATRETAQLLSDAACTAALRDVDESLRKLAAQRTPCDQLVSKLCADLGPDTESCRMVTARTPEIPTDGCTKMLAQYDMLLAEMRQREAANAPLDPATQAEIAAAGAPAFGPQDARVTAVVFSDFQCPYCARSATATKEIEEKYGDRVRFVFRQFPLDMHPEAHLAAQAALAAAAQGKFWAYHDLLFANQRALSRADLEKYAEQVGGINMTKFRAALDNKTHEARVKADMDAVQKAGARIGTPSFFINGKLLQGAQPFERFKEAVDEALKAKS